MNKLFYTALLLLAARFLSAQCIQTAACSNDTVSVCDLTPNSESFWNASYWWEPILESHDLPDAPVELNITATDDCPGAVLHFRYLLDLDLDHNGTPETRIDSDNLPATNTVFYNNLNGPGDARAFDQRPVALNDQYRFALELSGTGTTKTAALRWNTQNAGGAYVLPELPYGIHQITWEITDGLGNTHTCSYAIEIKDCKKPTVVCLNGISINLIQNGVVTLWASDLLIYVEDNSTLSPNIDIAIRRSGTGTGFPLDSAGNPQAGVIFTCADIGTQSVELWARDQAGNADYCETYLIVVDNLLFCGGGIDLTACLRLWNSGAPVVNVNYGLGLPFIGYDSLGCAQFDTPIPLGSDLTFAPSKNDDQMNGLNVLDLIRISQHILGIKPLPSPYAMIAADINKSNSITTFDIVEERKLLTGIYTELPNNNSWRFVDANFTFPDPSNPFTSQFPEFRTETNIQDSTLAFEFKAIKIGDVDGNAIPGLLGDADSRNATSLQMPDLHLQAGETADIPVTFATAGNWLGLQMSLRFDPEVLEIVGVSSDVLENWEPGNWAQPTSDVLNLVWASGRAISIDAGKATFSIKISAKQSAQLRDVIHLNAEGLSPQAWSASLEGHKLALGFSSNTASTTAIGQIFPNPTQSGIRIPLHLDKQSHVWVTVFNMQGRKVWEQTGDFSAGDLNFDIPAAVMEVPGLYGYRVQVGADNWSGKFVKK